MNELAGGWVVVLSVVVGCSSPSSAGVPNGGAGGNDARGGNGGATATGGQNSAGVSGQSGGSVANDCGVQSKFPEAFGSYIASYACDYCHGVFNCADDAKGALIHRGFDSVGQCAQYIVREWEHSRPQVDLEQLIAQGIVRVNTAAIADCTHWLALCVNGANMSDLTACRRVFSGTVAVGQSCYRNEECAGDAYCKTANANGLTAQCPGTCTARGAPGSACVTGNACTATLDYATCDGDLCYDLPFQFRTQPGETCGEGIPGERGFCTGDLWCDTTASAPTCRTRIDSGGECTQYQACAEGYFCETYPPPGTCQPVTVVNTAGESCDNSLVWCNTTKGLDCIGGRCTAIGDGSEGSTCIYGVGQTCNDGLLCDFGTCATLLPTGETCRAATDCLSYYCTPEGTCGDRACITY